MNAELLLMFTIGRDRAFLYGHPEQKLSDEEASRYEAALARRASGIPAQYITGHQEFWGMDLIVSPAVLIPRPETEHVIETVLALVASNQSLTGETPVAPQTDWNLERRASSPGHPCRVVDVGTGSGCIALALAKELPQAEINATDISSDALEIARANAARLELESRIRFHEGDLLTRFEPNSLDFIVSNPPYVGESEEDSVQLDVRKFEPRNAVFAGPLGTEVIERLIPQAHEVLKPGGCLVMEISGSIASRVRDLLSGWNEVHITNDLQGIARVISAQKV
jgi:release factor glutamine methyltransferase